jgi:hypothetical protein
MLGRASSPHGGTRHGGSKHGWPGALSHFASLSASHSQALHSLGPFLHAHLRGPGPQSPRPPPGCSVGPFPCPAHRHTLEDFLGQG